MIPSDETGMLKGRIHYMTPPTTIHDWNDVGYNYEPRLFNADKVEASNVTIQHIHKVSWDFLLLDCWAVANNGVLFKVCWLDVLPETNEAIVYPWDYDRFTNRVVYKRSQCRRIVASSDPRLELPLLSEEYQEGYCDHMGGTNYVLLKDYIL